MAVSLTRAARSSLSKQNSWTCVSALPALRGYATIPSRVHHRIIVVGGGTAGLTVAAQLRRVDGNRSQETRDIGIIDPAQDHHYQPGWTLVGTGLKPLDGMKRPLASLIPDGVQHYPLRVATFDPANNLVKTTEGVDVTYDCLVVAPGLETNFGAVSGLREALADPASGVSSIYSDKTVEQVWKNITVFRAGKAIFTQPAGIIKCAGAPQKVLWMAWSQWKRDGFRQNMDLTFATGAPSMFAVPAYSQALEKLRKERGVEGLFQHNLTSVNVKDKTATFANLGDKGAVVERPYDFLHVVPPQKPWDWVAQSPLADGAGWVDVDKFSTQHNKYPNVFSLGDASSLPNSKTAAAITAQAPVLVENLLATLQGKSPRHSYDGYASCPLLTGHKELMLCEFKYGGVRKETLEKIFGSQDKPRLAFYYVNRDFFPWVYWAHFVKGRWEGPKLFRGSVKEILTESVRHFPR